MPTKISVSGVSRRSDKSEYREHEYSIYVDEDITEQEAVNMVLSMASQEGGIYRRSGQAHDRITVEYIGVQADQPMIRLQPRDPATGRWAGYSELGRQLWRLEGPAGSTPRDASGHFVSYSEYARARGVSLVTGEVRATVGVSAAQGQAFLAQAFRSEPYKQERPSAEWRKERIRRTRTPYQAALNQEME